MYPILFNFICIYKYGPTISSDLINKYLGYEFCKSSSCLSSYFINKLLNKICRKERIENFLKVIDAYIE